METEIRAIIRDGEMIGMKDWPLLADCDLVYIAVMAGDIHIAFQSGKTIVLEMQAHNTCIVTIFGDDHA